MGRSASGHFVAFPKEGMPRYAEAGFYDLHEPDGTWLESAGRINPGSRFSSDLGGSPCTGTRQQAARLGPHAREDEEGQTEQARARKASPLLPTTPPRHGRSRASASRQPAPRGHCSNTSARSHFAAATRAFSRFGLAPIADILQLIAGLRPLPRIATMLFDCHALCVAMEGNATSLRRSAKRPLVRHPVRIAPRRFSLAKNAKPLHI